MTLTNRLIEPNTQSSITSLIKESILEVPVTSGRILQVAGFQDGLSPNILLTPGAPGATSSWNDISGNSEDFPQPTGGNQPIYTLNAINGLPAPNFNGSSQYLERAFSAALNPASFTMFIVCKVTGGAGTFRSPFTSRDAPSPNIRGYIIYAGSNNKWQAWVGTGPDFKGIRGGSRSVIIGESVIVRLEVTNGAQTLAINGQVVDTSTDTYLQNTTKPARIGAGKTEGSPGFFFPGIIGEEILYNRILSGSEIDAVERQYLSPKWGIPLA